MTHFKRQARTPFLVRSALRFDLANHLPILIGEETKKLIPTIIRLAQLFAYADPDRSYQFHLNSQEELEVQILAFRDLVNERYFPLGGIEEDSYELMSETVDEWIGHDQTYHPLLDSIPVLAMGIPDHDIELEDYEDVVGLLHWLGRIDPSSPRFDCGFALEEYWSAEEQREFRLVPIIEILEEMDLQSPLTHLAGLIRSVLHQTNTFFLDACPMCDHGSYLEWNVENFIWLRNDWLLAKPIHSGNQELIKWSNNSPERLAKISMILKKANSIHLFYGDEQLPEWCL